MKIAFAPICTRNNNRRIWRHNASASRSRDVTDQLWLRHNAKSEKTVLGDNGEINDCCAVNVPLPLTDTVQLPVNGPCKSRYLAINVICTTVISLNIQLYNCIAVFPRLHPNTTYMPNTDDTDYTDNRVVFIIWTDNVNAICTTTISSDIQLWYCIAVFPRLYPSNTYLPNTDYTDYTDNRVVFIIWTDNVNAPLTYHCR